MLTSRAGILFIILLAIELLSPVHQNLDLSFEDTKSHHQHQMLGIRWLRLTTLAPLKKLHDGS